MSPGDIRKLIQILERIAIALENIVESSNEEEEKSKWKN
jgi:hypothetical protein